jgi:hypothetical protein
MAPMSVFFGGGGSAGAHAGMPPVRRRRRGRTSFHVAARPTCIDSELKCRRGRVFGAPNIPTRQRRAPSARVHVDVPSRLLFESDRVIRLSVPAWSTCSRDAQRCEIVLPSFISYSDPGLLGAAGREGSNPTQMPTLEFPGTEMRPLPCPEHRNWPRARTSKKKKAPCCALLRPLGFGNRRFGTTGRAPSTQEMSRLLFPGHMSYTTRPGAYTLSTTYTFKDPIVLTSGWKHLGRVYLWVLSAR